MLESKEGVVLKVTGMLFLGLIITVLVLSLVSAGWWDNLRATITGKATSQAFDLNISVGNSAPNITQIIGANITAGFDPTEQDVRNVLFYFLVNDTDGYQNINLTSAKANFT